MSKYLHSYSYNLCIPRTWLCDAEADCPKGDDERVRGCVVPKTDSNNTDNEEDIEGEQEEIVAPVVSDEGGNELDPKENVEEDPIVEVKEENLLE